MNNEDITPETDPIYEATNLLMGGDSEPDPEPDESPAVLDEPQAPEAEPATDEPVEPDESLAPTDLKEAAERLKLDVADLYGLEIPGTEMTLGELKDRAQELQQSQEVLAKSEDNRATVENELMARRRELAVMAQNMGREPTDAERKQAEAAYQTYVGTENKLALDAIPDWKDPAVHRADVNKMTDLMTEYGLSKAEQVQVVDHRQLKLIRDYSLLRDRVKEAVKAGKVTTRKQAPSKPRKNASKTSDRAVAAFQKGELAQEGAVAALIAEG